MEYLTRSVQTYGILLANVSRAGEDPAEYMGLWIPTYGSLQKIIFQGTGIPLNF